MDTIGSSVVRQVLLQNECLRVRFRSVEGNFGMNIHSIARGVALELVGNGSTFGQPGTEDVFHLTSDHVVHYSNRFVIFASGLGIVVGKDDGDLLHSESAIGFFFDVAAVYIANFAASITAAAGSRRAFNFDTFAVFFLAWIATCVGLRITLNVKSDGIRDRVESTEAGSTSTSSDSLATTTSLTILRSTAVIVGANQLGTLFGAVSHALTNTGGTATAAESTSLATSGLTLIRAQIASGIGNYEITLAADNVKSEAKRTSVARGIGRTGTTVAVAVGDREAVQAGIINRVTVLSGKTVDTHGTTSTNRIKHIRSIAHAASGAGGSRTGIGEAVGDSSTILARVSSTVQILGGGTSRDESAIVVLERIERIAFRTSIVGSRPAVTIRTISGE